MASKQETGGVPRQEGISRRGVMLTSGAAIVAATGIVTSNFFRLSSPHIISASTSGNTLLASDANGAVIWRYAFPAPLQPITQERVEYGKPRVQVVDLAGNGDKQVIVAASFSDGTGDAYGDELYCFSSRGEVLWRYRPALTVRFGNDRFDGPWHITDMVAVPGKPKPLLFAAVSHWKWRPGFVIGIDLAGNSTVRFVQAGNLNALRHVVTRLGGYLIAGGINNEYNAASVAVLKDDSLPSRSPQKPGSRYEVLDGPAGVPEKYFLLPPSELNVISGEPYNQVNDLQHDKAWILVNTREVYLSTFAGIGCATYLFDNQQIEPKRVTYGSGYAAYHRQFQSVGKLNHKVEECLQLHRPVQIRRWDVESGWTDIEVPFASDLAPGANGAGVMVLPKPLNSDA